MIEGQITCIQRQDTAPTYEAIFPIDLNGGI